MQSIELLVCFNSVQVKLLPKFLNFMTHGANIAVYPLRFEKKCILSCTEQGVLSVLNKVLYLNRCLNSIFLYCKKPR